MDLAEAQDLTLSLALSHLVVVEVESTLVLVFLVALVAALGMAAFQAVRKQVGKATAVEMFRALALPTLLVAVVVELEGLAVPYLQAQRAVLVVSELRHQLLGHRLSERVVELEELVME
jgi:hypothetical protein